jgi:catalase
MCLVLRKLFPEDILDELQRTPAFGLQVLWLFGDRGIPKTYRHMNGYGVHAFSLINEKKERVWVRAHSTISAFDFCEVVVLYRPAF